MEYLKLNDMVDRAKRLLATIGITGIYELLSIEDEDESYDGWTVMTDIIKETYNRFEYWEPFVIKMPITSFNGTVTFTDNFEEVLNGTISPHHTFLIPRKILNLSGTFTGTLKGTNYIAPELCLSGRKGNFTATCICNRPLIIERNGNKYSERSGVYFLGDSEKPRMLRFYNLFYLNLATYIIRLNENTQHPSLPLEFFSGLNNWVSQLQSEVERDFDITHGYAGIYKQ